MAVPATVLCQNAVVTASRSPSVAFGAGYTPALNDLVILACNSGTAASAMTVPATWVNTLSSNTNVASDAHTGAVIYHFVTSGEVSGVTTTYTATNLWNSTVTGNVVGIVVRGINTTTPINLTNTTFDSANAAANAILAVLAGASLGSGSFVLGCCFKDGTSTFTAPAGWTIPANGSSNTNAGSAIVTRDTLTTSGSDVPQTTVTAGSNDEYATFTIALYAAQVARSVALPGSGLLTNTAFAKFARSVALAGSGALSATKFAKFAVTKAFTGTGTLTATTMAKIALTRAFTGPGTLTATTSAKFARSTALPGSGLLTATAQMYRIAAGVSLSGHGVLSATAVVTVSRSFAATGTLSAPGYARFARSVSQTGSGALSAVAALYRLAVEATLSGQGALSATATPAVGAERSAALGGAGSLSARCVQLVTGQLAGQGLLSATPVPALLGHLSGQGTLSAIPSVVVVREGSLLGAGALSATAVELAISRVQTTQVYDLTGASISVQLVTPPLMSDGTAESDLYITNITHEIAIAWRNGNLLVLSDGTPLTSVAYDPAQHQWQRMREASGTLHFEVSGQGVSWTTLATMASPGWIGSVLFGLKSTCDPGAPDPGVAVYDHFNVPPAYPAPDGHGALSATTELILGRTVAGLFDSFSIEDHTLWDFFGSASVVDGQLQLAGAS